MSAQPETARAQLTQLLLDYQADGGSDAALDRLMPLLYDGLHELAHRHLRRERAGHTLNTTALVHEAYLRLADGTRLSWQSEVQFYALASRVMRRILIDYARRRNAEKRGGGRRPTGLDGKALGLGTEEAGELLALDAALDRLSRHDARLGHIVEYRFFGGMTVAETAAALGLSERTVKREWRRAKAWLYAALHEA